MDQLPHNYYWLTNAIFLFLLLFTSIHMNSSKRKKGFVKQSALCEISNSCSYCQALFCCRLRRKFVSWLYLRKIGRHVLNSARFFLLTSDFNPHWVTLDNLPLSSDHVDGLADILALVVVSRVFDDQTVLVASLQNLKYQSNNANAVVSCLFLIYAPVAMGVSGATGIWGADFLPRSRSG